MADIEKIKEALQQYTGNNETLNIFVENTHFNVLDEKVNDIKNILEQNGVKVEVVVSSVQTTDKVKRLKEIFGDKYDDFHKINSNQEDREKIRLQFISDYVKANKLPITKIKDFGWDPVTLP